VGVKAKDMDLRDAFAAAALSDLEGLRHREEPECMENVAHIAECAYLLAEAMLAYRAAHPLP
jgi:hypothetical protein